MNPKSQFDTHGFLFVTKCIAVAFLLYGAIQYAPQAAIHSMKVEASYNEASRTDGEIASIVQQRKARVLDQNRILDTRIIGSANTNDYLPSTGKFIGIDLVAMKATLYQDAQPQESLDVLSKGRPGSFWETPSGFYTIQTKEKNHFSSIGKVYMPYSMQFFGNFFIHGWPNYPDGTPVPKNYSGGCIRLSTENAQKIFNFADKGTGIFVYDKSENNANRFFSIKVKNRPLPNITAESFVVADMNAGNVFVEKNADVKRPIASITKLMTAIVANETISFEKEVSVFNNNDQSHGDYGSIRKGDTFIVSDILFPLLMESNNAVAHSLSSFYGKNNFIKWMNTKAQAIGMKDTSFEDASGISGGNISTANDLFNLAKYIYHKKSFVFGISKEKKKNIISQSGEKYTFKNFNVFSEDNSFVGGKTGFTNAAKETMLSVFNVPIGNATSTVAIIVLKSDDRTQDTKNLLQWFKEAAVPAL